MFTLAKKIKVDPSKKPMIVGTIASIDLVVGGAMVGISGHMQGGSSSAPTVGHNCYWKKNRRVGVPLRPP